MIPLHSYIALWFGLTLSLCSSLKIPPFFISRRFSFSNFFPAISALIHIDQPYFDKSNLIRKISASIRNSQDYKSHTIGTNTMHTESIFKFKRRLSHSSRTHALDHTHSQWDSNRQASLAGERSVWRAICSDLFIMCRQSTHWKNKRRNRSFKKVENNHNQSVIKTIRANAIDKPETMNN